MNWLAQLLNKLFAFVPRFWFVSPNEGGIRLTAGARVGKLVPGWYIYWPMIQMCQNIIITPQVVDLRGQSVLTEDGRDLFVSGAIAYRISDVEKALLAVQDYDQSILALTLAVISDYVGKHQFAECMDRDALQNNVLLCIREKAAGWGLKIQNVYITDIGTVRNIRVVGVTTTVPIMTEYEGVE